MTKKLPNPKTNKKEDSTDSVSKFRTDETQIKNETIPNAVVTGGWEEVGLKRIQPIEIEKYLLMHPTVPRGIEMKVNRMIKLVDEELEENVLPNRSNTDLAKEAREYCKKILADSGGPLFIKKYAQGAFRFGTSFAVLQTNDRGDTVTRFEHQHEVFFGPARYPGELESPNWGEIKKGDRPRLSGRMKIDAKTKSIDKYTQYMKQYASKDTNYDGTSFIDTHRPGVEVLSQPKLVPVGQEFDKEVVFQLFFDSFGDEPLGISIIQFLFLTIKYLLSMEKGAAQTQVNFGFNKWVANTPFKDQNKLQQFSGSLSKINVDSVICLPENTSIQNIQPGRTDFDRVHPIFMKLLAIRLGIPMPLLTQDGSSTNKASIAEMRKDMYEDFVADELTIEASINDAFWKSCRIKYHTKSHEELEKIVPRFKFKTPPEDKDTKMDRDLKFSLMIRNFSTAAVDMSEQGYSEVVKDIAIKIRELLYSSYDPQEVTAIMTKFQPKVIEKPKEDVK